MKDLCRVVFGCMIGIALLVIIAIAWAESPLAGGFCTLAVGIFGYLFTLE